MISSSRSGTFTKNASRSYPWCQKLVGEPDTEAEGAAKLVVDLGAAKLRRRRVEGVVDRDEHLDCIGPAIGCAQIEIGHGRDPVIVNIYTLDIIGADARRTPVATLSG